MKECPYCGKEMLEGYIPTDATPVQWIPAGKMQSPVRFLMAYSGIPLSGSKTMLGNRAEAFYCEACGIVLSRVEK